MADAPGSCNGGEERGEAAGVTNEAQRDYWSEGPGRHWVAHQAELDAIHAPVAELLLTAAAPRPGERLLDIGCGAGATCLMAAPMVAPAGEVTGIDISAPLVARARERVAEAGLRHVTIELADAQTLPRPARPWDLAISRCGLMFFDDPVAGLRNVANLLAPDARLVFAAWAGAEHNPWFRLPLEAAAERLGPAAPNDPDGPGPLAFRSRERVEALLARAGYLHLASREAEVRLVHPGGLDGAVSLARHVGPVARYLRDKGGDAADLAAILDRLRGAFAAFETKADFAVPARVNLFEARTG